MTHSKTFSINTGWSGERLRIESLELSAYTQKFTSPGSMYRMSQKEGKDKIWEIIKCN